MTDISNSELRRLDLTVLLVFLGLLKRRNATQVAADLGLTQSGVSQALKRLREVFSDDLFLRRPHGLDPTAVALRLEEPLRSAVDTLRQALGDGQPFDPASSQRVVRLAALDAEQAAFVPGLVADCVNEAPRIQISVVPLARRQAMDALQTGEIDLAIGFFWDVPDTLLVTPLYEQGFLVAGKPELLGTELTLEAYARMDHVLVSPAGDLRGVADDALEALGLSRRVVASVPQFFPALATIAQTGCIVTLPDGLARMFAPAFGLATVEPPVNLRRFAISALRHRRNERDGAVNWIVTRLKSRNHVKLPI